jgi:alkanesulfonate monooxygenase SsuD/methylene tetrahydromethanopterin reductase-like flavin-dependent oxidoreductase (luciferase family)
MIEGQEGLTWARWRRLAEAVDALGFESLCRSDHLFSLSARPDRPGLEAWTSMTALALITRRIRFGPLVSPITFYHPAILARQAAAVDELSGGRFVLGIGTGWHDREHEAFGVPYPRAGERVRRLGEAARVIRALWDDGPATLEGRYYPLAGAEGWPKPAQRPAPLLIAGKGPKVLAIVARYADEWNTGAAAPDEIRARRALLEAACGAIGRDPAAIKYSVMCGILIGETGAALERRARKIQEYVPSRASAPARELPAALRSAHWLVGTPDEVAAQIGQLAAEGIERVLLQMFDQEDLDALHLIDEQVLPRLRDMRATRPRLEPRA